MEKPRWAFNLQVGNSSLKVVKKWWVSDGSFISLSDPCGWRIVWVCFSLGLVRAVLLVLGILIGKKRRVSRIKKVAFECGFDKIRGARVPFSLQFYHLGLLFLIFDLELVLFMPLVVGLNASLFRMGAGGVFFFAVIFIFILLVGLGHEYREGTLS